MLVQKTFAGSLVFLDDLSPGAARSMASVGEPLRRSPFALEHRSYEPPSTRAPPILSSATAPGPRYGDPMDTSHPPQTTMGPPMLSQNAERQADHPQAEQHQHQHQGMGMGVINGQVAGQSQPVGAAAAAQQPKVVQTAFIHKLYKSVERNFSLLQCTRLTFSQYARRSRHTTLDFMVKLERELCHVAFL